MHHRDVFCQGGNIADAMDQAGFHMPAHFGTSLRSKRDASTAHSLSNDKAEPFFDARENQDVATAHQFRYVITVSQDTDTRVGKHGGKLLGVCWQELSC